MTVKALPVISFRSADCGVQFVDSLRIFGFAVLVDHPLDMDRVARIYRQWRHYFTRGVPAELAHDESLQDGYFSVGNAEHAKGYRQRDFKEYFQYYTWGRCPASLKGDLHDHYLASLEFAATLLDYVEQTVPGEVSARFEVPLGTMIANSEQSMLRVLHYPPVLKGRQVLRAAPHEDINLLTILPASDGPGLEICDRHGAWVAVPNRPDQVVVNVGDMLQELSGGYLPSTTHRVALPSASASALAVSRMSLPLFLHPRPEVVLSPRYTAASYLSQRLLELGVA